MSNFIGEVVGQAVARMLTAAIVVCLLVGALCGGGAVAVWNWRSQPTPADCYSLEESLAEHYFTGETVRRYATTGRIKVNDWTVESEAGLQQCLCDGDKIEVRLEHPPIKPDGTPADDKRSWVVGRER